MDDYKWELTTVFTSDGKQLSENMAVNEEDAVQAGLFDKAEPDDEEYEGWIRNEGAKTTHFNHRSYLVHMPRACRFEILNEAANERKANITTWIDMLIQEMGKNPHAAPLRRNLRSFARRSSPQTLLGETAKRTRELCLMTMTL